MNRDPPDEPEQLELALDCEEDELDFHHWMLAMQDPAKNPQIRGDHQSPERRQPQQQKLARQKRDSPRPGGASRTTGARGASPTTP